MRGFVWFVLGGIMALSALAKDVPSASPKITNSPLVSHVWFTSSLAAHKLSYATPPRMKSASAFLSSFSGSPIAKQSGERLFASIASSWVSRTESVDVAVTVAENVSAHSEISSQHVAHLANIAVSRQTFDDRTSKMYSGLDGQYSSTMNVILKVAFLTLQSTTTMPSPNLLPFSSLPTTEPSILTVSFKKSSSIRSTDASLSSRALLDEETYIRLAFGPSSILPHIRQDKPRQGSRNSGFFEDLSTTYAQSSTPVVSYPVSRASVESLEYSAPEHRNKDISSFVVHDSTQLTTTIFSTTLLSSTPSTSTSSSPPFPPLSSMPSRPLPSSSRSPSHPPLSLLSSSPSISSSLPTSSSSPPSPSSTSISSLSSLSSSASPSPNSSLSLPPSPSPLPSKLESQSGIPTSLLLPSTSLSLFLSTSPLSSPSLLSMPPLPSTSPSLAQSSLPSFPLLFPLPSSSSSLLPLLSSLSTTMPSSLPLSSPSALQSSPLLTSSLSPSRSSSDPSSSSPPSPPLPVSSSSSSSLFSLSSSSLVTSSSSPPPPPPPPLPSTSSSLFSLSSSSSVTSSSSSPPPSPKVQSLALLLPSQLLTPSLSPPSSLSSSSSLLPPKSQLSTPLPLSLPPTTLLSPPQSSSPSSLPSTPSLSPPSSKSKSQSLLSPPPLPLLSSPTASSFSSSPLLSPLSIPSSFSTPSLSRPPLPMSTQPPPLLLSSSSSPSSFLTPSLLRTSPLPSPSLPLPLSSHFSSSPPVPHLSLLPSSLSLNLLPDPSATPLLYPLTMKSTLSPKAHLLSSSFTSSPSPSKLSTPAASSSLSSLSSLLSSSKTLQPQVSSSSSSSSPSSPSSSSSSLSSSLSPSMPSVPVNSYVTYLETRFLKSTPASIFTSTDSSSGDHVVPSAFSSHLHQKETTTVIHITVPVELTTPKPTENQEESTTREAPVDTKMWEASLKIENMEFNSNLAYNSSKAFKDLASDLEVLLIGILNQVPGFLNVKVDSFTKGSIICNFFIYTKAESTATTEEIENALIAASKRGETGNYNITDIHVKDNVNVDTVKDEKPSRENGFLLLKIIGGTVIAAALAMVIAFLLVKAIKKRRRRQREGYLKTRDVYPLNEFTSSKAEVEEKRPALKTRHMPDDEEAGDGDDEATPFYKPGYAQA